MNGKIYDQLIEQYKSAKTAKERQDCVWTMICMIGTNHLPHIEERMDKQEKKNNKRMNLMLAFLVAILLLLVTYNSESLSFIFKLIGGLF